MVSTNDDGCTANVDPSDGWQRQMLAVIAFEPAYVPILLDAWNALDAAVRADTIVYVTVTNGADDPLY